MAQHWKVHPVQVMSSVLSCRQQPCTFPSAALQHTCKLWCHGMPASNAQLQTACTMVYGRVCLPCQVLCCNLFPRLYCSNLSIATAFGSPAFGSPILAQNQPCDCALCVTGTAGRVRSTCWITCWSARAAATCSTRSRTARSSASTARSGGSCAAGCGM